VAESKAAFIPPMLLLPTAMLPEGRAWSYELKLDAQVAGPVNEPFTIRTTLFDDFVFRKLTDGRIHADQEQ
jgi:hypothetical protein